MVVFFMQHILYGSFATENCIEKSKCHKGSSRNYVTLFGGGGRVTAKVYMMLQEGAGGWGDCTIFVTLHKFFKIIEMSH